MYDQSAAHWRQKVGTLGFLFRALREQRLGDNNTFDALSHYVHEKGGLDPLERSLACIVPEARLELHVWCPRRDSKGLRFAKPRASGAWHPRHAPLQTGHRPVCLTLRALTRVRHEKGGLNPLERSLACMVPEARLELARCCQRWILSPLRLPIPPLGHVMRELVYHSLLSISPKMELRAFRRVRPYGASHADGIRDRRLRPRPSDCRRGPRACH